MCSFCYVSDTVRALMALMNGDYLGPVNMGNPNEYTVLELAETVQRMIDPSAKIVFKECPSDDPRRRQPDITKAKKYLNWQPTVMLEEGLRRTIADFRERLAASKALARAPATTASASSSSSSSSSAAATSTTTAPAAKTA